MIRKDSPFSRLLNVDQDGDADNRDLETLAPHATPFISGAGQKPVSSAEARGAYGEAASKDEPEPLVEERPVHEILGDLTGLNRSELTARRREFARRYHPDRSANPSAADAHERMSLANRLIDEAMNAREH